MKRTPCRFLILSLLLLSPTLGQFNTLSAQMQLLDIYPQGKQHWRSKYHAVDRDIHDGLYRVMSVPVGSITYHGFVDPSGNEVINPVWHAATPFSEGRAAVKNLEGRWGLIDPTGFELSAFQFDSALTPASNGIVAVKVKSGWRFWDANQNKYLNNESYEAVRSFESGFAGVKKNGRWGYIKPNGTLHIEHIYSAVDDFVTLESQTSPIAAVRLDGKSFFINPKGEMIFGAQLFGEETRRFVNGLAGIRQNGRWGFVNELGQQVIPAAYDRAANFTQKGYAAVAQGGKWGVIDSLGRTVVGFQYDEIWLGHGLLAAAKRNGEFYYLDIPSNTPAFNKQYAYAEEHLYGVARVKLKGQAKYSYLDEDGNLLSDLRYPDWLVREVW
jgi:hypothetical protein